jgi:hypothetical protein
MAEQVITRVKDVRTEVLERKDGKGTFEVIKLTDDSGTEFSGYASDLKTPVNSGDTVTMTVQSIKTKAGTANKILSLSQGGKLATRSDTPASGYTKKTEAYVAPSSNFNNKGARTGGVLHDAVAIAIHNAGVSKETVNLQEVEALAEALLDLATRLEG